MIESPTKSASFSSKSAFFFFKKCFFLLLFFLENCCTRTVIVNSWLQRTVMWVRSFFRLDLHFVICLSFVAHSSIQLEQLTLLPQKQNQWKTSWCHTEFTADVSLQCVPVQVRPRHWAPDRNRVTCPVWTCISFSLAVRTVRRGGELRRDEGVAARARPAPRP